MKKILLSFILIISPLILTACTAQPMKQQGSQNQNQNTNTQQSMSQNSEDQTEKTEATQEPISDDTSLKTIEQELDNTKILNEDFSDLE
ncbi:hypothetical protein GYA49_04770 [Candidatus Beckwithbacteria bacterium]|nr:hypothetical protein [Candidatus Beckwithbacteria bacterium]